MCCHTLALFVDVLTYTSSRRVHRGGSPLPMNPPIARSFKFQNQRHARSLRASTFSRLITGVFHHMRMRRSFNFQGSDRCRARKTVTCVARGGGVTDYYTLSRRGQGGSFRCKTVSTASASVRKGPMTRRRASTATLFSQQNEEHRVQSPPFFWSLGIRGRNQ